MNATEKQYVEKLKELVEHYRKKETYPSHLDSLWRKGRRQLETEISSLEQQIEDGEEELTYENFKKTIKFINCYYRHISKRNECIDFHIKYIQPMEEFINQHKTIIS